MASETERDFKLHELFFSTTDLNGKVQNGNEVFTRISGYSSEELRGKPHSIIRHPEMPRVVFRLLWRRIQAGTPIAAYVKNRAKDGLPYWVLAYVTPIPNSYLSVRFKPTTQFFQVVSNLYTELRRVEREIETQPGRTKDEAIEASHAMLVKALNGLGFPDYDSFIETALFAEFSSRRATLEAEGGAVHTKRPENSTQMQDILFHISKQLGSILERHQDFSAVDSNIASVTDFIAALSLRVQRASLNLTIKSEQSDQMGGGLSIVAQWLHTGSEKVRNELERLLKPIRSEMQQLRMGLFSVATSQLQIEMIQYFINEMNTCSEQVRGYSGAEAVQLMQALGLSAQKTFTESLPKFEKLTRAIKNVGEAFSELQREVMGLSLAHVNGRVECSRMPDAVSFEAILDEAMQDAAQAKAKILSLENYFSSIGCLMADFSVKAKKLPRSYSDLLNSVAPD